MAALLTPPSARAALPPAPSILALVAADPEVGEVGVAVLAGAPAAVADVGRARAGVGAAALQGRSDRGAALRALDLLSQGVPPQRVVEALASEDPDPASLQIAVVDASAHAAARSGNDLAPWKGTLEAKSYACLGSGITGEKVILAMGVAFETTRGDLVDRLLAALAAGQQAEGSLRPKRSAALSVARGPSPAPPEAAPAAAAAAPIASAGAAAAPGSAPAALIPAAPAPPPAPAPPALPPIDLRVDDHEDPVGELRRLLGILDSTVLHRLGSRAIEQTRGDDVRQAQEMLRALGFYAGETTGVLDDATVAAVRAFRRGAALPDEPRLDATAIEALLARYRERQRQNPSTAASPTPPGGPVETDILPDALEPPPAAPAPAAPPPPGGGQSPPLR